MAPVVLRHASLWTPLSATRPPTCRALVHHTTAPWPTIGLTTLVYNHRVILGLNPQLFPHSRLHLPRAILALCVIFVK
uniref:Putative secreted protein n=1 Tax=Panstrongylus lignarius TaxID=156445 RepID=A0A224Y599_9HEMI